MILKIDFYIDELALMKKYPDELFYIGNTELLKKRKVSIIGTRRPNSYTKEFTYKLASKLSKVHISEYSDSNAGVQPDTFSMRFSRL